MNRNRKSIKKKNFIIGKGKKYSFSYNFFLLKDKPIEELNILFFAIFSQQLVYCTQCMPIVTFLFFKRIIIK